MRNSTLSSLIALGLTGALTLLVSGCAGTPKVSRWVSSTDLALDHVFNAALKAGADNKFTVLSSDRTAGLITMTRQEYAGEKMAERRMNVRLRRVGDKIEVATKVSGSDFGVIEGALGGLVHEEITRNFYVYLFRELNISDQSSKQIIVEDAR